MSVFLCYYGNIWILKRDINLEIITLTKKILKKSIKYENKEQA